MQVCVTLSFLLLNNDLIGIPQPHTNNSISWKQPFQCLIDFEELWMELLIIRRPENLAQTTILNISSCAETNGNGQTNCCAGQIQTKKNAPNNPTSTC